MSHYLSASPAPSFTGKLVLSVVKDTYEQLGLQGRPSHYQKQHRHGNSLSRKIYMIKVHTLANALYIHCPVVEVDLKAAHFKPGKANYEHVKQCLNERLEQDVDFLLGWAHKGKL